VIEGLVKLPDFNGKRGVVQCLDEETGRYNVLLDSPAGPTQQRWAKVKRSNLRLAIPPPPHHTPTLSLDAFAPQGLGQPYFEEMPKTPMWAEDFSGVRAKAPLSLTALV